MQPRGHEEIASPFGTRGGEDRRLELEKPLSLHPPAKRINDLPAQHDVLVQLLAPEIKEPVPEPGILGIGLVAEHRQRQIAGRAQHFNLTDVNLDKPGRHFGVFRPRRALAHLAVDPDDEFGPQLLGRAEGGRIRIDNALGQAVMVPQIDEQHPTVIADAMAPAGKPNVGAILGEGQGAAGVGAVAMHNRVFFASDGVEPRCLNENGERGKGEVGEARALSRPVVIDRVIPKRAGRNGPWVSVPIHVKFMMTRCSKRYTVLKLP